MRDSLSLMGAKVAWPPSPWIVAQPVEVRRTPDTPRPVPGPITPMGAPAVAVPPPICR